MATSKDPVCGMEVETYGARYVAQHGGVTYAFCGSGCRRAFEAEPSKYLDPGYKPSMSGALVDVVRAVFRRRSS